jgi:hypothetical protein
MTTEQIQSEIDREIEKVFWDTDLEYYRANREKETWFPLVELLLSYIFGTAKIPNKRIRIFTDIYRGLDILRLNQRDEARVKRHIIAKFVNYLKEEKKHD